jgi:hypothetical protein
VGQAIGHRIELSIGDGLVSGFDRDLIRVLLDDLLKPLRNRFLDIFLREFNKRSRRVIALRPNRRLFWRKAADAGSLFILQPCVSQICWGIRVPY